MEGAGIAGKTDCSYRIVLDGPFLGGLSFRIKDDYGQKTIGKMLNELQVLVRATILRGVDRAGIDGILPKFKTSLIELLSELYAVDRYGMQVSNRCLMRSAVGPGGNAILVRFWVGHAGPRPERPTVIEIKGGMRDYEDEREELPVCSDGGSRPADRAFLGAHKSFSFCPQPHSNKKEESPRPSAPPREDEEKSLPPADPELPPSSSV